MDFIDIDIDGKNVRIPEFASDKSIQLISKILKEQLKVAVGNKDGKAIAKLLSTRNVEEKKTQTAEQKERDRQKKRDANQKLAADKAYKQQQEHGKKLDANQGVLKKAMDNLAGSGGVFGSAMGGISKFARFISPLTAAFAGLVKGVQAAFKFLMKLGRLENTLFRTGLSGFADRDGQVATGVSTFAKQALDANLSIDQFAELTQQFATAAGEFGTQTLSDAIGSTQKLIKEQGFLGLSVNEMAGATAEVSDILRQLGFDQTMQSGTIATQTVQLLRTTQAFTKLTNASNELIRTLTLQASQVTSFTNALQMLSGGDRLSTLESAQTAFAGLAAFGEQTGGDLSQALSDAIGKGGLQFTQFGQDLQAVSPGLFASLQNLAETVKADGDVIGALDSFKDSIKDVDEGQRPFLRNLMIAGVPMADFVTKLANMSDIIDDNSFSIMEETKARETAGQLGKVQAELAQIIAKVKTAFTSLLVSFLTPDVINGFASVMEMVMGALDKLANYIKGDFFDNLNGYMHKIGNFISQLFDGSMFNNVIGGMSTGLTDMFVAILSKAMALVTPGGHNADTFKLLDQHMASYKDATNKMKGMSPGNPQHAVLAKQQADAIKAMFLAEGGYDKDQIDQYLATGKDTSFGKNMNRFMRGKGFMSAGYGDTNFDHQAALQDSIGQYGYSFNDQPKKQMTTTGFKDSDYVPGSSTYTNPYAGKFQMDTGMSTTSATKSNIKIMPMFGDANNPSKTVNEKLLEEYIKANELSAEQTAELRKMYNELIKINSNTKETQT